MSQSDANGTRRSDSFDLQVIAVTERISRVEGRLDGLATKAEVEKAKNQILYTVIGVGGFIIVGLATAIIRLWPES